MSTHISSPPTGATALHHLQPTISPPQNTHNSLKYCRFNRIRLWTDGPEISAALSLDWVYKLKHVLPRAKLPSLPVLSCEKL